VNLSTDDVAEVPWGVRATTLTVPAASPGAIAVHLVVEEQDVLGLAVVPN
jgi:hypothetical protein